MNYQNIRGANIEVATQNMAKAYMPISNIIIRKQNETTHGK